MRHSTPCTLLHAFGLVVLAGCSASPPPDPVISDATRLQLARALVAQGDTAGAASILNGSGSSDRVGNSIELRRAATLLKFGEVDEALTLARTAVTNHPNDPEFGLELARMAVRAGRPTVASQAYRDLLNKSPDNVDAMVGEGAMLAQAGDMPGAMARFRQALARKPDDVAARNNLALAMTMTGRSAEAVPMLEQLSRDQGSSTLVRDNLARARAGSAAAGSVGTPISEPPTPVATTPLVLTVPTPVAPSRSSSDPLPVASTDPSVFSAVVARDSGATPGPTPLDAVPTAGPAPATAPARLPSELERAPAPVRPPTVLSFADEAVPGVPLTSVMTSGALPGTSQNPALPGLPPDPVVTPSGSTRDGQSTLSVQLGSVGSRDDAIALWDGLSARHPSLLEGMDPRYEEASVRGRTYWRVRAGAFPDRRTASDFCRRLRDAGAACIAQF